MAGIGETVDDQLDKKKPSPSVAGSKNQGKIQVAEGSTSRDLENGPASVLTVLMKERIHKSISEIVKVLRWMLISGVAIFTALYNFYVRCSVWWLLFTLVLFISLFCTWRLLANLRTVYCSMKKVALRDLADNDTEEGWVTSTWGKFYWLAGCTCGAVFLIGLLLAIACRIIPCGPPACVPPPCPRPPKLLWPLTPAGTPLVPYLDGKGTKSTLVAPSSSPSIRSVSTVKASRLSASQSESNLPSRSTRSSSAMHTPVSSSQYSINSNKSNSILNTSSASVSSYIRSSTPSSRSSSITRSSTPSASPKVSSSRRQSSPIVVQGGIIEPLTGRSVVHANGKLSDRVDSQRELSARKPVKASSTESTGFGRTISKKSLDVAIRNMDIKNGSNITRPFAGSNLFPRKIRPINLKSQAGYSSVAENRRNHSVSGNEDEKSSASSRYDMILLRGFEEQ